MSDKRLDRLIHDIRRLANQLEEVFGPAEVDDDPTTATREMRARIAGEHGYEQYTLPDMPAPTDTSEAEKPSGCDATLKAMAEAEEAIKRTAEINKALKAKAAEPLTGTSEEAKQVCTCDHLPAGSLHDSSCPAAEPLTGVALRWAVAEIWSFNNGEYVELKGEEVRVYWRAMVISDFRPDTDPCHCALALMAAPEKMRREYNVELDIRTPTIWKGGDDDPIIEGLEEICQILTTYAEGE